LKTVEQVRHIYVDPDEADGCPGAQFDLPVTGSAGGLGRGIAEALLAVGGRLVATARR